ncbi:15-hydroxyprostaglandin dehydrogenase [NAD(+)]-like [Patiria miniata]|uniref:15-hydroxyprostaglandin dehydrogenase [NAD(+)] n=1 Tax=Patiria miniata TaxID=46514 RepID=A0A914BS43_PATMI|nr:15-hydroxyprostaglandin dehydrogenase [NAD(+)]-like [Patiria miniata]XP_038078437.1 15-hydroxyprostaglandin dehydrogenase [NAD(+)]-like [Patiria miniata]XP_038078438.1 15-hydroxyprostaglandin dehydrogenase [NAD(+)]-like [Patiria miniata]XP_038078439.1 15-hydroxyprostaglandin dehydrogenase [NAD(+)]-like [Patiria miniata]XP_038078440.1 15-hydroxyprostaglandin dehydrogenase [NAD(+)]-like [Patiria miniata]XP_038078441.1 15-hydroxyprostaglandin dehydrogenase [NAD(+)]-like [Patiria miniata]XP_03
MANTETTQTEAFDLATAHFNPDTVAIVTGSAEGLGKAFAEVMLQRGVKGVCIADINETKGKETAKEFQKYGEEKVVFVKCDITLEADLEAVFAKTKEVFGTVNLVVNNAGVQDEKNWRMCVNVNVTGTLSATYTALKHMSLDEGGQGGTIINMASIAGLAPIPYMPTYAASKHAVIGLTKSIMAHPFTKAKGITIGALCPAFVDTNMIQEERVILRCEADRPIALGTVNKVGVLKVSEVTDAFLTLVLDKAWAGKIMKISKATGISESPMM